MWKIINLALIRVILVSVWKVKNFHSFFSLFRYILHLTLLQVQKLEKKEKLSSRWQAKETSARDACGGFLEPAHLWASQYISDFKMCYFQCTYYEKICSGWKSYEILHHFLFQHQFKVVLTQLSKKYL